MHSPIDQMDAPFDRQKRLFLSSLRDSRAEKTQGKPAIAPSVSDQAAIQPTSLLFIITAESRRRDILPYFGRLYTITESGEYTVALDFTGTAQGFSNGVAFSAIGISNGERLHSNWCIHITECLINGQPYTLKGRPYTTSDNGICTRTNLFNEWVTSMPADAQVLYGPNIGISAQLFDRSDPVFSHIETISVTFRYAPKQ